MTNKTIFFAFIMSFLSVIWMFEAKKPMRLARAIYVQDVPYIRWALENGQSPNQSINGKTLLVLAFEGDGPKIVAVINELVSHGANINQRSKGGDTALMEATMWGIFPAVRLLLKGGADPNLTDDDGRTALMLMGEFGDQRLSLEIAKALLEKGADPCIKDRFGKSAITRAKARNNTILFDLLLNKCSQGRN